MGAKGDREVQAVSKRKDPTARKRLRLGDVLEIPLSRKRYAYVQYVFYHRDPPVWGYLIRVLPGTYSRRPAEFRPLVDGPERFVAFCPIGVGLRLGGWKIVANEPVPDRFEKLPLFKAHNRDYHTGYTTWFLRDGPEAKQIGDQLPEEYWDLPNLELVSHDLLVERIERGWLPRDDVFYTPPTALRKREPNI
jgi:hypothetical protein